MLEHIHDSDDKVIAYCEWMLVNKFGCADSKGEYVFVRDMFVHKDLDGLRTIRRFISDVIAKCPTAQWAYWERRKYGNRMKMFSKKRISKWAAATQQYKHPHHQ